VHKRAKRGKGGWRGIQVKEIPASVSLRSIRGRSEWQLKRASRRGDSEDDRLNGTTKKIRKRARDRSVLGDCYRGTGEKPKGKGGGKRKKGKQGGGKQKGWQRENNAKNTS